jgi:glycosyltransferase involved in cell wall biosynthesis
VTDPVVSICIPAYGRPRELRTAIASVLRQDWSSLELVVGDDSGDLETVAREFQDERVHYVRNPRRLGMAANWTNVLDRARGRFVGLLMDDDWLLPDFIGQCARQLASDASLGIAFTNHYFQYGNRVSARKCRLNQGRYNSFLLPLLLHKPVAVSAALMRREVWAQVRPLPDLLSADLVMHIRTALTGWAFYYLATPLMVYRVHPGQLTASEFQFRDDGVRAWEMFEFGDADCERVRQQHLARALASRGASYLKHSDPEKARADLRRAESLDRTAIGLRQVLLMHLIDRPVLLAIAKCCGRVGQRLSVQLLRLWWKLRKRRATSTAIVRITA